MDIDMSLDDLAAANKKPTNPRPTGSRTNSGPRRSTGDGAPRAQAPYSRPPPASTGSSWQHDMFPGQGGAKGGAGQAAGGGAGGARPYRAEGNPNVPTAKIRIEGLHYEIQKVQLEKIFSQCGKIVDGPTIQYDRSGRSTGVATVTYDSVSAAKWAREKLDGQKANGEPIKITYAQIFVPRATGVATTGPGASLLGRLGGVAGESKAAPTGPRAGGRVASTGKPTGKPAPGPAAGRGPRPARGVGAGAGDKAARPAKKGPANQDDLDKELAAFMKTDEAAAPAPAAAAAGGEAAMEE